MARSIRWRRLLRLQRCRRLDELPNLTARLFDALRREDRKALAERFADAVMRMLAACFGGDETGAEHQKEELRRALRHMEEPKMLAETATRWRQEALDEGMRLGVSEGISHQRALLRRLAARRLASLAAPMANEKDVERLAKVGDLVLDCATADNLLRRTAARQKPSQRRKLAHTTRGQIRRGVVPTPRHPSSTSASVTPSSLSFFRTSSARLSRSGLNTISMTPDTPPRIQRLRSLL